MDDKERHREDLIEQSEIRELERLTKDMKITKMSEIKEDKEDKKMTRFYLQLGLNLGMSMFTVFVATYYVVSASFGQNTVL
jgi:hypothetical protein